ncbi:MAG: hypothetical protein R3C49_10820 [Planctomycetaceae bacterium]
MIALGGGTSMVRVSDEVAEAVRAANGQPVDIEVPGVDRHYLIVDAEQHKANLERLAIMEGLADLAAGRTHSVEDVSAEIQSMLKERLEG